MSYGNLNKLLNIVDNNRDCFAYKDEPTDTTPPVTKHKINEHRSLIEEQQSIIDRLFTWRDKAFAHNDAKYFNNRELLADEAQLTIRDIDRLIFIAWKILSDYIIAFDGKSIVLGALNNTDVDKVLDILHKHREQQLTEIQNWKRAMLTGAGLCITDESKEDQK